MNLQCDKNFLKKPDTYHGQDWSEKTVLSQWHSRRFVVVCSINLNASYNYKPQNNQNDKSGC